MVVLDGALAINREFPFLHVWCELVLMDITIGDKRLLELMLSAGALEYDRDGSFCIPSGVYAHFGHRATGMAQALELIDFESFFRLDLLLHEIIVHEADLLGHVFIVLLDHFFDDRHVHANFEAFVAHFLRKVPIYAQHRAKLRNSLHLHIVIGDLQRAQRFTVLNWLCQYHYAVL